MLRYLDSDPEEQRHGITMRASPIGLRHLYIPPQRGTSSSLSQGNNGNVAINCKGGSNGSMRRDGDNSNVAGLPSWPCNMVVHLIGSPGHVDFSAKVTSSLLLCNLVILVMDTVKGLCTIITLWSTRRTFTG